MPLPVLRVSLSGVTTIKGTICRESPLSPGKSPKAFAGFKNPSQAVHHQEEEAVGLCVLSPVCFSLSPGLARVPPVARTNGSLTIHCSF